MSPEHKYIAHYLSEYKMPEMATLLRTLKPAILRRWDEADREAIPNMDKLTTQQVRDSIPIVLEHLAMILQNSDAAATAEFYRVSSAHGIVRYHESFSIEGLMTEYRILHVIVLEEIWAQQDLIAADRRGDQFIALNAGLDIAFQQATLGYVHFQQEQLKAANEAESTYLSFLSHDLRNNLNNITLTMDLLSYRLQNQPDFAEDYSSLLAARRSIWETMDGMERLMQAERLKRKALEPRFEQVKIYPVVDRLITPLLPRTQEKNISLRNEVPRDLTLNIDEQLLTLVLQNLIGNAIKYSDSGDVWIRCEKGGAAHDRWVFSVRDSGKGIAPAERDRLFDAFHRGQTHGQTGVGLGLAIVASAAKLLRAEVRVASEVGKGSTFTVMLPIEANVEET